jgi:hypothetical protein
MNADLISGRALLAKWLNGGYFLQLVVSAKDGSPSFTTLVQLTSVEPERIEATLPEVPVVMFVFILPPNATINTGWPAAGSTPFEMAEFADWMSKEPWAIITFPALGCFIALGEIRE